MLHLPTRGETTFKIEADLKFQWWKDGTNLKNDSNYSRLFDVDLVALESMKFFTIDV